MFPSSVEFARLSDQNNRGLDLLVEVGTQCERASIVQLLVTRPPHGIAHSLCLNLSSKGHLAPGTFCNEVTSKDSLPLHE
jgi:hypothetical protein